jgi:outer membrane protein OmpA-like peptidoglycan-associated protein
MGDRFRCAGGAAATWTLAALLALQGCASTSTPSKPEAPAPAGPTAPPKVSTPPARNATVAVERQWLQSWFQGTPVRIEQRSEASFSVEVPREFCFEVGRAEVKPALGAVLDKVAQSLQRKPALRMPLLAAPADASGTASLAQQRAGNVRKHLISRGVSAEQLAPPSVSQMAAVQLRIDLAAP